MFVGANEKIYEGMIIGENAKSDDLDVNPMKAKQLTNVRASGKDEAIRLTPPRRPTLEQAIAYIEDDELVEVTPKSIRLRKQVLNPSFRKKLASKEGLSRHGERRLLPHGRRELDALPPFCHRNMVNFPSSPQSRSPLPRKRHRANARISGADVP